MRFVAPGAVVVLVFPLIQFRLSWRQSDFLGLLARPFGVLRGFPLVRGANEVNDFSGPQNRVANECD